MGARTALMALALVACTGTDDTGTNDTDTSSDTDVATACIDEGGACKLEGTYTEDLWLTADRPWLLRGAVQIGDDSSEVTLHIEAGTQIYGESASNSFLVITRGANIEADGTATAPIVFTSDQPEGQRARGDWGGIAINGYGLVNACADGSDPCEAEGEGGTGTYGGSDNTDSSGFLRYVVIQFGGTEISTDNEINGLGLQGCGSGTEIDHVQVHRNLDDGIEMWGGAPQLKHVLVTAPGDDGMDWDLGYQGKIQFALVEQAADLGNHGWETDTNEANHLATPASTPTISNVTLIGSEAIAEDNFGVVFRRGSSPKVSNLAVTGFSAGCLAIRDEATIAAFVGGEASLDHTVLACDAPFEDTDEAAIFEDGDDNAIVSDLMLDGYQPRNDSPLLDEGRAPNDPFFDEADYIGAFDGTTDWTAGWTTNAQN
jgi:trimeric autotransporter adhesin